MMVCNALARPGAEHALAYAEAAVLRASVTGAHAHVDEALARTQRAEMYVPPGGDRWRELR